MYIRKEYLRPALVNGVSYSEFWQLTPVSLNDIIEAKIEAANRQYALVDKQNWELGIYIKNAYAEVLSKAFSKKAKTGSEYPKKPFYYKLLQETPRGDEPLTEEEKKLETMKFKQFFNNLGKYVNIQDNKKNKVKGGVTNAKE